jgi:hypothetical protein
LNGRYTQSDATPSVYHRDDSLCRLCDADANPRAHADSDTNRDARTADANDHTVINANANCNARANIDADDYTHACATPHADDYADCLAARHRVEKFERGRRADDARWNSVAQVVRAADVQLYPLTRAPGDAR